MSKENEGFFWMHGNGSMFRNEEGIFLSGTIIDGRLEPPEKVIIYNTETDSSFAATINKIIKSGRTLKTAGNEDGELSVLTDMFMMLFEEGADLIVFRPEDKDRVLAAYRQENGNSTAEEAGASGVSAEDRTKIKQEIDTNEKEDSSVFKDRRVLAAAGVIIVLALLFIGILIGKAFTGGSEEDTDITADDTVVGSTEYNGHRYQVFDDPLRWDEAEALCESNGGHLVIVNDVEEQQMLTALIENSSAGQMHYWLGGNKESGEWKWIDGEGIPMIGETWGYQNWEAGKPNNNKKAAGYTGSESYLELQATHNESDYMKWNDVDMDGVAAGYEEAPEYNSTKYYGYICEWDN